MKTILVNHLWLGLFALNLFIGSSVLGQESLKTPLETYREIRSKIDKRFTLNLKDVTIDIFAERIGELLDVNVLVDERALDDYNLTPESVKLNGHFRNMRMSTILNHVLRDYDLAWTERRGSVYIVTPEDIDDNLFTAPYDVRDIVTTGHPVGDPLFFTKSQAIERLSTLVMNTVCPQCWADLGGPCSLRIVDNVIVVKAFAEVHDGIEATLNATRQAIKQNSDPETARSSKSLMGIPVSVDEDEFKIKSVLEQVVEFEYLDASLTTVADNLSEQYGINCIVDKRSLDDLGLSPDHKISAKLRRMPLKDALRFTLAKVDLCVEIYGDALWITTPVSCPVTRMRIYPVGALLHGTMATRYHLHEELAAALKNGSNRGIWDDVGGECSIAPFHRHNLLFIDAYDYAHPEIAMILRQLEEVGEPANAINNESDAGKDADAFERRIFFIRSAEFEKRQTPGRTEIGPGRPVPKIDQDSKSNRYSNKTKTTSVESTELADLITRTIEPSSWSESDRAIHAVSGRLVIKHDLEVQRKVFKLLKELDVLEGVNDPFVPGKITRLSR